MTATTAARTAAPTARPAPGPAAGGTAEQAAAQRAEQHLVDERTGLVTRLVPHRGAPGMPAAWVGCAAHVADTRAFAGWQADRFGYGAALGDPAAARGAALGEAVERYCGNVVPTDLRVTTHDALRRAGEPAVDPQRVALHSARQYAQPGFPFVPFTRDLPVAWVAGEQLAGPSHAPGTRVLVPASLVHLDFYRGAQAGHPPTNALRYAGIAAGPTRADAERSALEELLERDATALWWGSGAPAATLTGLDHLVARLQDAEAATRTVRFLRVPSDVDVPVVAVLVEDHARGLVAFGTAARADVERAATKALVEAFAVLSITLGLADPGSATWRAVRAGALPATLYRPFRADRTYRDAFRDDWHDLVDLPPVAQLYLDPRMQGAPLDRLRRGSPQVASADVAACGPDPRRHHLDQLAARGLDVVTVDLTTPDVRAAGLHVVRVVVPGLYDNAAAAFPLLGGTRLYDVPVARGWVPGPLTEARVERQPVPLP